MIRRVEGPCLIVVQSTSHRPQNHVGSYLGPLIQNPFVYPCMVSVPTSFSSSFSL